MHKYNLRKDYQLWDTEKWEKETEDTETWDTETWDTFTWDTGTRCGYQNELMRSWNIKEVIGVNIILKRKKHDRCQICLELWLALQMPVTQQRYYFSTRYFQDLHNLFKGDWHN